MKTEKSPPRVSRVSSPSQSIAGIIIPNHEGGATAKRAVSAEKNDRAVLITTIWASCA